jgi:hypothetical protein
MIGWIGLVLVVVDLGKQVHYLIWSHDNMGEGFFFVQALILFADGRLVLKKLLRLSSFLHTRKKSQS